MEKFFSFVVVVVASRSELCILNAPELSDMLFLAQSSLSE